MKLTLLKTLPNVYVWTSTFLLQAIPGTSTFIAKYIFEDFGFIKWLTIAMMLDLLTGVAKVYKAGGVKAITSRGLRDTITKCIQYGAFLIITHVVTHFEIGGVKVTSDMEWINKLAMEFILIIEVKSVYENVVAINPKFDFLKAVWEKAVQFFPAKKATDTTKDA